MKTGSMQNKIILVTGGATGIGRASAQLLAANGATLIVSDVNTQQGHETVDDITAQGGLAEFVPCDVSSSKDVEDLHEHIIETHSRLDGAFNNAGISGQLDLATIDYPEALFDKVIAVNLKGVWLCMKAQIPHMRKQGHGSIVNMSSVAGLVGILNSAYTASKHGVVGLTKAAALEHSKDNIRVNAVCPGYVETPTTAQAMANDAIRSALIRRHPIGRLGEQNEIAEAVMWLLSDAASFVTGHAMPIDGGMTAQ